jgi:hypothetical protein
MTKIQELIEKHGLRTLIGCAILFMILTIRFYCIEIYKESLPSLPHNAMEEQGAYK